MNKVDKFFSKLHSSKVEVSEAISIADAEVIKYLHETITEGEMTTTTKKCFIKYNTGIPSSAHCERMFSTAGHLVTDKRGRMTDENFERRMLLKFNNYNKSSE